MSIKIDKSLFTAEELANYEALIAKATVDPEKAQKEMADEEMPRKRRFFEEFKEEDEDETEKADAKKSNCKKSTSPEIAKAMERLEKLEKSLEMKQFTEIAKKYAPLGENEEDLAKTLYDMHKSNEANYDAYIAVLDKSLGLIEKSGIFAEIGKSYRGDSARGAVGKVEELASQIMKSDTSLTREQAMVKAWENHPELIGEYESEYRG